MPASAVAGGAILHEVPHRFGVHLLRAYRSVMLWAASLPERRTGGMFVAGGMATFAGKIAADVQGSEDVPREPLILIACELAREEPDVPHLARACLAIADWALARGSPATASAFADAAAAVHPNARHALVSGRLHRERGQAREARQWLHRASILASRDRDREARSKALLSSGTLHLVAGRYEHAELYFRQARAFAARHRLREQIGEASHDLFTVAIATKNRKAADAALADAVRHYGSGHHRLPALGHDVAAYWMELNDFESARSALLALLDRHFFEEPPVRLLAFGTTLRALGGCDRAEEFDTVYGEFQRLANTAGRTPRLAQALLAAANGAISLREWGTAESLLSAAAEEAIETGQQDTMLYVKRMMPRVWERREEPRPVSNPRTYRARAEERSMEWLRKLICGSLG
jgi:tetratricopeptide (TPR) repeat protein